MTTMIRTEVEKAPAGALFSVDDFVRDSRDVSRATVKVALHRLAAKGVLRRARRGLYWKSARSRFGPGRPLVEDMVVKLERGKGLGPTGWLASHVLGLSTQVPAVPEFVLVGDPPRSMPDAVFHTRANPKRAELRYEEIALLEVLRSWPNHVEASWSDLTRTVRDLCVHKRIDLPHVAEVVRFERPYALCERVEHLRWDVERRPLTPDKLSPASLEKP